MRLFRSLAVAAATALALALPGATTASAATAGSPAQPTYYVSFGDSLSQGYQPGLGDTSQGYVDDVYAALKLTHPKLQLVKLGCSGETTVTMINGGKCSYGSFASQLAAGEDFLSRHQGQVAYLTLNIGGNDVNACAAGGTVDMACVPAALQTVGTNLTGILQRLRAAAGTSTPVSAGMGTHDPLLAAWLSGPSGQTLARQSVQLVGTFNSLEQQVYQAAGFRWADANAVWNTDDFDHSLPVPGYGTLPLNVAEICLFTTMCTANDLHPNPVGYGLIAAAFLKVMG
ncbi:GDSL-type esterase/lipase family protein [Kitasatospora sp. NPDC093102]|uniref:SGNH/GDSL hydrolase family protein n=1 Tax=Kitasatospora sp. NPDC093102 TaxID=3155069 RepID=UPI00343CCFB4